MSKISEKLFKKHHDRLNCMIRHVEGCIQVFQPEIYSDWEAFNEACEQRLGHSCFENEAHNLKMPYYEAYGLLAALEKKVSSKNQPLNSAIDDAALAYLGLCLNVAEEAKEAVLVEAYIEDVILYTGDFNELAPKLSIVATISPKSKNTMYARGFVQISSNSMQLGPEKDVAGEAGLKTRTLRGRATVEVASLGWALTKDVMEHSLFFALCTGSAVGHWVPARIEGITPQQPKDS